MDARATRHGHAGEVGGQSVELEAVDGYKAYVLLADTGRGRIINVIENARSRPAAVDQASPRRHGSPPVPVSDQKLHPIVIRRTKWLRDELQRVAIAAGRVPDPEIEDRLARSVGENRDKEDAKLRLENLTRQIIDLVRANPNHIDRSRVA